MIQKKKSTDMTLPKLPSLSDSFNTLPFSDSRENNLPSFPSSPLGDEIAREAIKNSVSQENLGLDYPDDIDKVDIDSNEELPEIFTPKPIEYPKQTQEFIPQKVSSRPVYVKIDSYKKALETFEEIKIKVGEIEGLMAEVKEVKKREEFELDEWGNEIQGLKEKIDEIQKNLFSKLD